MDEPRAIAASVMEELARVRRARTARPRKVERWATDEFKRREQLLKGARAGDADAIATLWREFRCRIL